jgi:hypothetical protein
MSKEFLTYLIDEDDLKKLFLEKQTLNILKYLRDKQVHDVSVTKEEIARHLDERGISSRPTTLKIVQRLLDHKIILNVKERDNTFSRLIINPSFDWRAIEIDLLTSFVKGIQTHFVDFNNETKDVNTELVGDLLKTISHYDTKKKTVYTKKP